MTLLKTYDWHRLLDVNGTLYKESQIRVLGTINIKTFKQTTFKRII